MKKIILIFILLLTTVGLFAQEQQPSGTNFKSGFSVSWCYYLPDSSIWMYKGATYGWTQIATAKHVKFKVDSIFGKVYNKTQIDAFLSGKQPLLVNPLIKADTASLVATKYNVSLKQNKLLNPVVKGDSTVVFATPKQVNSFLLLKSDTSTVNQHIRNVSNPHNVTKLQVGLGNVDNTSDLNKPISTAEVIELNKKVAYIDTTNWIATKINLLKFRQLTNHDSLSTLDEKSYNSLSDKPNLSIYRTLSNHDSLSQLDEKSYNSLTDKPTIPAAQIQSDWDQSNNILLDYIKNKPDLSLKADKSTIGQNNGIAPLDAGGKVPFSYLPASLYINKGTWSASANLPALANGTGVNGWVYQAVTEGTVDFGAGNIAFSVGDYVGYNGTVWQFSPGTNSVKSVNGQQGIVTIGTDNVTEGTTNKYYTDTRARGAISKTAPITYDNTTGTIGISQSSASTNGYLSSSDWQTFNGKSNTSGTITSVGLSMPTGFTVSGSPVTSSGTLTAAMTAGYFMPLSNDKLTWDKALQWDGGNTGLTASTGRTSLGATTVGSNLFTLTNPGAITFPRINADNTVSALDAATFRTAIGAGTSSTTGTVTGTGTTDELTYWTGTNSIGTLSTGTYPSKTELSYVKGVTGAIQTQFTGKQASLVSGTNIRTVGSTSILGSGDIPFPTLSDLSGQPQINGTGFVKAVGTTISYDNSTYLTSLAHNLAGDVSGSYASNTVDKIKGYSVDGTAPSSGDFFRYNGSTWLHTGLVSADIPNNAANTSGSAANSTRWGGYENYLAGGPYMSNPDGILGYASGTVYRYAKEGVSSFLGLGSNAYSSTAYQPLENQRLSTTNSPTFAKTISSNGSINTWYDVDGIYAHYTSLCLSSTIGYSTYIYGGGSNEITVSSSGVTLNHALPVGSGGTGATSLGTSLTNSGSILNTIQDIRTSASPTFNNGTFNGNLAFANGTWGTNGAFGVNSAGLFTSEAGSSYFTGYRFTTGANIGLFISSTGLVTANSLATGLTGLLKGNGTSAVTAAVAGTDYDKFSSVGLYGMTNGFNDATTNNIDYGGYGNYVIPNSPWSGYFNGGAQYFGTTNGKGFQIAFGALTNDFSIRNYWFGSFGNWNKIITDNTIASYASPAHSATANYLLKSTGSGGIGQSIFSDNGTNGTVSGNITASSFIKSGGTSAQYLLADGSVTTTAGAVYKGQVNGSTGSGLADGTGTTGWYYACSTAGSYNYGSGSITLAIGDQLYYNGTIWLKVPGAGSYTLPNADGTTLGGVKIGSGVSVSSGTISVSTAYAPTNGSTSVTTLGTINTGIWNGTAIGDSYISSSTNWNKYNQWDGGSTGLTASTGRTSLGLVIGTDVLAYRTFGSAANSATGDFRSSSWVPSWSDVTSKPTNLSSFTNDLGNYGGWITGYTETDPNVYAWAKASTKPSYTYSEVGAISNSTSQQTSANFNIDGSGVLGGSITAAGGGFNSLRSLKNIHKDWTGSALNELMKFKLRDFNYKKRPDYDQTLGFIIDEIPTSMTKYVLLNKEKNAINTYSMIGLTVKALQEANTKIESLESRISVLEKAMTAVINQQNKAKLCAN